MSDLHSLFKDERFKSAVIGALQAMLWDHMHNSDGPSPFKVCRYVGSGKGAPKFSALQVDIVDRDYEAVAYVNIDGSVTTVLKSDLQF